MRFKSRLAVFTFVTFILFLPTSSPAQSPPEAPHPYVESIEGTGSATLVRGGQSSSVLEGDELQEDDEIRTGAENAVRVVFPDGSALAISRESDLQIGAGDIASVVVKKGTVKSIIIKQNPDNRPAAHKFFIKTNSAVMGVRGTEFDVEETPAGSSLHTLDGIVDVAKDRETIESGRGQPVNKNEALFANPSGISKPKPFDRQKYLAAFQARHFKLTTIANRKIRDANELRAKRARKVYNPKEKQRRRGRRRR